MTVDARRLREVLAANRMSPRPWRLDEETNAILDADGAYERMEHLADEGRVRLLGLSADTKQGIQPERVFLLADTFRFGRFATDPQEQNLYYIAVTRAAHTLVRVHGGARKERR